MSEKVIADALGLRPLEEIRAAGSSNTTVEIYDVPEQSVTLMPDTSIDDEVLNDIETAKQNIKDLIEKGNDSLDELISIAKQSEQARAFEVATNMMKMLIDANRDFVAMSEKKKFAKEDTSNSPAQTNVTNNNLILSTTDLLKMMKGEAK